MEEKNVVKWESKIDLIHKTVAAGTSRDEFDLFIYLAKQYNLDPLLKQIWAIKYDRNRPASIFCGRDGFLKIAHESGQFDGMKTFSLNTVGKEIPVCLNKADLAGAICYVYRKDCREPFVVAVSLAEYDKGQSNWKTMAETMIKKVAESQALRKAFNVSGLYSPDEMPPEMQAVEKPVDVVNGNADKIKTLFADNPEIKKHCQSLLDKGAVNREQLTSIFIRLEWDPGKISQEVGGLLEDIHLEAAQ